MENIKGLKKIREHLGLSQREIGDITGVDPNTLSRYERGKLTPSSSVVVQIANALHVTTDELLNGSDEKEFEVKILMGVKSLVGLSGVEVTDNTFLYGVEDNKPQIHLAGKVLIGTPEERAKAREILLKKFDEACWMFDHKDDAAAAANKNIEE